MTEPTFACPKCGQPFAMSQLHAHFITCTGPKPQQQIQSPFPQYPAPPVQQIPQQPIYQQPLFVPPPKPEHKHRWSENNTYKVCIAYLYDQAEECREIKVKLRGSWMIFLRYGLKLFWIQMIIALAIAFSISSYIGIHH